MVKHSAPPQKSSYFGFNFHVNSSLISSEKAKAVRKVKNFVCMLQMDLQNLKRDKTQETVTVIKDSIEFSSTDSYTNKSISKSAKITRKAVRRDTE